MNDYLIDVAKVEELQMLNDLDALEKIFTRAHSAIVNGAKAVLVRKSVPFDELSTLPDLEAYRKTVFKYLG